MGVFVAGQGWLYEGMVVGREYNSGYHDDYEYAVVWNPATKSTFQTLVWATAYAGGALWGIDATPEVLAEMEAAQKATREAAERRKARAGKRMKVVGGRKVPKGTEGTVVWVGKSQYGRKVTIRVGLKDDGGTVHWTAETNLEEVGA